MRGIVWGSTFESACEELDEIIDDYVRFRCGIDKIVKNKNSYYVYFQNGDIWRAVKASDVMLGVRCNVAYVERNISYDIFCTIIGPCTVCPPFSAIQLYGEGNLHITDTIEHPF